MPGIDDGGEVKQLCLAQPVSLPSDGRPHRFKVFAFESAVSVNRLCWPELAEEVLLVSTQHNTSAHPILAGPTDLIRSSGWVRRTRTLFVAPQERFDLSWGPDPELRVKRQQRRLKEETQALGPWTTVPYRVAVHLSNLGARDKRITVIERVPVSEIEAVRVEVQTAETTDGALPDAQGFIRWQVKLGTRAHLTLKLAYCVQHHNDVVW